jgi:hypothetical protein
MLRKKSVPAMFRRVICILSATAVWLSALCVPFSYAADAGSNRALHVQLNAVSMDSLSGPGTLTFTAEVSGSSSQFPDESLRKEILKYIDYFLVCLSLPDDKLWVNLDPNEPYRMMDSALAETDIGGIMLTADLSLKKDVCELMDPQRSEIGKEFWKRLYEKSGQSIGADEVIVMNRFWIAPVEARVYETEQRLSLERTRLQVCLEKAYTNAGRTEQSPFQAYTEGLINELILPQLNKRINEGETYRELRSMFRALILARWYRNRVNVQQSPLLQNINCKAVKGAERFFLCRPEQVYREYLNSFKKGQDFVGGKGSFSAMTIIQYFLGGIDFRSMKLTRVSTLGQGFGMNGYLFNVQVRVPGEFQEGVNPLHYVLNTSSVTPQLSGQGPVVAAQLLPPVVSSGMVSHMERRVNPQDNRTVLSKL